MRRLLTYVRPYLRLTIVALVFLILLSLVDLVGRALIGYGIDHYIAPTTQTLSETQRTKGLLEVSSVYLFVLSIGLLLRYLHFLLFSLLWYLYMFGMRRWVVY